MAISPGSHARVSLRQKVLSVGQHVGPSLLANTAVLTNS
jgi:hypothetical protein